MRKVLLIVNARAGAVSPRAKEVIAKALSADFKLEVADTVAPRHAVELSKDAVDRGFEAVVAFGGDGTINEAAQGLVGTDVALGILPGGSTNVMARSLGMPTHPVDATAYVASRLNTRTTRRINVGQIAERYFVFSAGMGLDAEVVRRVESRPDLKRRWGRWAFVGSALSAALSRYRGAEPCIAVDVEGHERARVVLLVCANARPFTYFGRFPVDVVPQAALDGGLDLYGVKKVRTGTVPRMAWAVFVSRSHVRWRNAVYHHDIATARATADVPMPVQTDGDYIGDRSDVTLRLVPHALDLIL